MGGGKAQLEEVTIELERETPLDIIYILTHKQCKQAKSDYEIIVLFWSLFVCCEWTPPVLILQQIRNLYHNFQEI